MNKYLDEYLKGKEAEGFSPNPHYFEDGDYISLFLTNERCYAVSITDRLTVFYSNANDDVVGCKIERARDLLGARTK